LGGREGQECVCCTDTKKGFGSSYPFLGWMEGRTSEEEGQLRDFKKKKGNPQRNGLNRKGTEASSIVGGEENVASSSSSKKEEPEKGLIKEKKGSACEVRGSPARPSNGKKKIHLERARQRKN